MDFDNLQVFEGKAKKIFEQELDDLIKSVLDEETGDDFNVVSSVEDEQIIPKGDGARRRLNLRLVQETGQGLRVFIDVFLDVRSARTYEKSFFIETISTALDSEAEREAFILTLQLSDSTFAPINVMSKFTINDEEIPVIQKPSATPWVYIGPIVGVCAMTLSVVAFFLVRRRRRDDPSFNEAEFYEDPHPPIDKRISTEVNVTENDADVSTLGDPFYPHGPGVFSSAFREMGSEP